MRSIPETFQTAVEHHRAGRLLEAEHYYRRVLEAYPRHSGAVHRLGLIAFQADKQELAAQYVTDAIKFDGFNALYRVDLGEIYDAMGKTSEAIASFEQAVRLNPELASAHNRLGMLHRKQGAVERAICCFQDALELDPKLTEAHCNLGAALQAQGMLIDAQATYEEAIRIAPADAASYFRLGTALQEQGQLLEAIACYHKASRLKPNLDGVAFQLATVRLTRGEFAAGWGDFDLFHRRLYPAASALPTWKGGQLQGQKVWLHARYAPGDAFQFIRYARLLADRGAEVFLDCNPPLIPLFEQSGFKHVAIDQSPPCDLQTHLLSLPRIFNTTLDSIPSAKSYLSASPRLVDAWSEKLKTISGFKVGIAWQGNPAFALARSRSMRLKEFATLAKVPGIALISLQKHFGVEQLTAPGNGFTVVDLGEDVDEANGAFMDTAAIITNLDLVITADSSVAHLAGALGANVWVALPFSAGWRWLENRDDSPWYPSMRLYRQRTLGAWPEVFERMAADLTRLVSQRSNAPC